MSVVSREVLERRLPLRRPLSTGAGALTERAVLLFMVRDREGRVGVGESAPLPWAGTEDLSMSRAALDAAVHGQAPDPSKTPAASAAVELAQLDLECKRAGLPLCRRLSATAAADVGVNALLSGADQTELVDAAVEAVEAGFRTLKLKVGAGPTPSLDRDRARVAAVRAAIGPGPRLRLDANGAWSLEAAATALATLAEADIELIEQPVADGPEAVAQLGTLRAASPIPIAADESATSVERVAALLAASAMDILVLKPMRLGGLARSLECARRAQEAGVPVVVTTFLGSAVERAAALHLAACVDAGNPRPLDHGLATAGLLSSDVAAPLPISHGRMSPPLGPGHGVVPQIP